MDQMRDGTCKSSRQTSLGPALHASDLLLVRVRLESRIQVRPPLEEHRVADELEPRSELQRRVLELLLQVFCRNVLCGLDLVLVGLQVDVGLDEEDVVNYRQLAREAWPVVHDN